jgi:MYXO-CTERM domain-containing protein
MLRKSTFFSALVATAGLGSAAQATVELGTSAAIFDEVAQSDVATSMSIVLPVDDSTEIPLVVESYRLTDGELVMTGHVEGDIASPFMLRGTTLRIYGWVYFRDEKLAYEYSTNEYGVAVVEQVPASRVCSSCDGNSPPRTAVAPAALSAPDIAAITASATATEPHLGSYPGTDLLTLESRPGATKVLYMNISPILSNGTPSSATAGNGTAWTKDDIWKVWQTVASAYSAFNVNVTTSPSVFSATTTKNVGVANFVAQNDTSFCYQGTFGTGQYQCTIYATKPCETEPMGFGRTVSHEFGHLLGMLDAGQGSTAYYEGNSTYQWYPIMGNYYFGTGSNAVVQWSKGEWANANSDAKIDALASISGFLGYRSDDISSVAMTISGTAVSADGNRGQITGASDTDDFTFTIGSSGGSVNLTIDRIEYIGGAMLDVLATLKNSSGTTLATSNPTASRKATISQSSLAAGDYTLTIQGGYEGSASNGFTAYGSIGFYGIEGTVTGSSSSSTGTGGASNTGGASSTGGAAGTGGVTSTGGKANTGGNSTGTGGKATGGAISAGGNSNTGGKATGGAINAGGNTNTGGATNAGGNTNTGGKATGGNTTATGGSNASATGGSNTNVTGGSNTNATGGSNTNATGGSNTNATGGSNTNATSGASSTVIGGTSVGGSVSPSMGGANGTVTTATDGTPVGAEGSCSCSVPGTSQRPAAWLALGLLPMLLLRRRRRLTRG